MTTVRLERVRIDAAVFDAIVRHARRDVPHECCGMLVGAADAIDESVPMINAAASRSRFALDPAEHIALNRRLRGTGRSVVGVYHSHPQGPAQPSSTDVGESHYPAFVHLIVSLADPGHPDVRAFQILDGAAHAVALVVR